MAHWMAGALAVSILVATSATAGSAGSLSEAAPGDKVICKRYVETGSLMKSRKECRTRAEWQKLAVEGRNQAKEMVLKGITSQQTN